MFGWLKWGKRVDPMADPDQLRESIAGLPANDPARALERIAGWLDTITQTRSIEAEPRWTAVDLLDQAAVMRRRKLAQDYLTTPRLEKAEAVRMWGASFGFWKALAAAYLRCIESFRAAGAGPRVLAQDALALIAGRALRAAGHQLRWSYLRHVQVDARVWRELGSAYLFAEGQGLAGTRAELYPADGTRSNAQEELLKALMLVTASPYNLPPVKLHLAERLITHFAARFALRETPAPECTFCFDLATAKPPLRLQGATPAGSMLRYFGVGTAEAAVAELTQEVRARDGIPGALNLGGTFDPDAVVSVLGHLARNWDSTPPARRGERSEITTRVTVVPGLPNILRYLEFLASGAPVDPRHFVEQESWTVLDKSENGYGVLVPEERPTFMVDPVTGERSGNGDWLRIGSLVAVCEEGDTAWHVSVVRRITYDEANRRRAGLELLQGAAIVVKLAPASGPRANEPERRRSAVLLSPSRDQRSEVLVLMRDGHYASTQNLSLHLEDADYFLEPAGLIEGGDDFDCARFRLVPA